MWTRISACPTPLKPPPTSAGDPGTSAGVVSVVPFVTPADSGYALTGLQPIDLTVGCGQRILLGNVSKWTSPCRRAQCPARALTGTVRSCTNAVTLVTYELNGSRVGHRVRGMRRGSGLRPRSDLGSRSQHADRNSIRRPGRTSAVTTPLARYAVALPSMSGGHRRRATRPCGAIVEFPLPPRTIAMRCRPSFARHPPAVCSHPATPPSPCNRDRRGR